MLSLLSGCFLLLSSSSLACSLATMILSANVFLQGLLLGLSLIVAIGAQNAFVLRQGLRREHVGSIVLFCAVSDGLLITAGVMGMAQALGRQPALARAMAFAGFAFLAWYGWQALRRAQSAGQLTADPKGAGLGHGTAIAQAAAFTFLNPHVYLDTVLLLGGIGAQQAQSLQGWFAAGASTGSLLWFSALGFGARWLAPVFERPRSWQVLDVLIGLTMWAMSASLLRLALS